LLQVESDDEKQDENNSGDEKNQSDKLYRPPKLVPIYNGNNFSFFVKNYNIDKILFLY
jgi:hypothetical protein